MNKLVTIFTPTYNRAHLLPRLYESLCSQDSMNFIWFVIDDGSSDNTKRLIEKYIIDAKIEIKFMSVDNGGKHRALNRAIKESNTELFFIVDSDDYIADNAVNIIEKVWNQVTNKIELVGICFRRAEINGQLIGKLFKKDKGSFASMFQITYLHGINVDRAEVFRTDILKKFTFDEIPGEIFLPEALVWNRISRSTPNKLICSNTPIYYCEYQQGGLSHSFMKLLKKNPKGLMRYYWELLRTPQVWYYPIVVVKATLRLLQCTYFYLTK